MKSHTGGAFSLGKGILYGTSTRQKINTKSSTEAELVGVNEVLPQILWTRYFLEAQGHLITHNIIYQDNQSSILLEKNGKASSSKRRRHINIRYFFITDRIKSGEVTVEYCPTGDMIADPFTKPLQGSAFRKFRNLIMNDPHSETGADHRSVLEHETKNGVYVPCKVRFVHEPSTIYFDVAGSPKDGTIDKADIGNGWTVVTLNRSTRMRRSTSDLELVERSNRSKKR